MIYSSFIETCTIDKTAGIPDIIVMLYIACQRCKVYSGQSTLWPRMIYSSFIETCTIDKTADFSSEERSKAAVYRGLNY